MLLTSVMCVSLAVYHESRGATIEEQNLVASSVYNRARNSGNSECDEVFKPKQYSWTIKYPRINKFKDMNQFYKIYGITDNKAFYNAMVVSVINQANVEDKNVLYFHDKSIVQFAFNNGVKMIYNTPNFKFYRKV